MIPTYHPPPYLVGSDNVDINRLAKLYESADSLSELARQLGVPRGRVEYLFKKHNIPTKRTGFKSPRNVPIPKGKEHYNWKGGSYITNGYVYEYAPEHPMACKRKGYVQQHRLVMEKHLGRYLESHEMVHHINGDKTDNGIKNLEVLSRSKHISKHKKNAMRDNNGRFTC